MPVPTVSPAQRNECMNLCSNGFRESCVFAGLLVFSSQSIQAAYISEIEGNNSISTAQNVDAAFDLSYNVAIEDNQLINTSTRIPHAEVHATGDGTADFYSFTLTAGNEFRLDIDCGWVSDIDNGSCTSTSQVDTYMVLYTPATSPVGSVEIDSNDQSPLPDTGSWWEWPTTPDAALGSTLVSSDFSGLWIVGVFGSSSLSGVSGDYILNISVGGHELTSPLPLPPTAILLVSGLLPIFGASFIKRRSVKKLVTLQPSTSTIPALSNKSIVCLKRSFFTKAAYAFSVVLTDAWPSRR